MGGGLGCEVGKLGPWLLVGGRLVQTVERAWTLMGMAVQTCGVAGRKEGRKIATLGLTLNPGEEAEDEWELRALLLGGRR